MTEYDAVLFDNDGVLVEPPARETQARATRTAFQETGVEDPAQSHVDEVVNGVTVERLRAICSEYGVDPETFWTARERHDERVQFEAFSAGERGRYDDVPAITDLSVPSGVVSNNHHSTIRFVLERFEMGSTVATYYGREKTIESLRLKKPSPHYLESALADLDADAALYVGDSESDVVAAHRAGIDSAFLRRDHTRGTDLQVDPTYEVGDLHAVVDLIESGTDPGRESPD